MADPVPANGQFGDDYFPVYSLNNKVKVDAKYLKDSYGENYIIDPTTSKPYIVPRDYDPNKTVTYFSDKLKEALQNPYGNEIDLGRVAAFIYPELYRAFRQGGWGDLQRQLPDKNDPVTEFKPIGNFNYGLGTAAGGLATGEAVLAGGAYVPWNGKFGQYFENMRKEPTGLGNYAGDAVHIRNGAEHFNQRIFEGSNALGP